MDLLDIFLCEPSEKGKVTNSIKCFQFTIISRFFWVWIFDAITNKDESFIIHNFPGEFKLHFDFRWSNQLTSFKIVVVYYINAL